MLIQTRNMCYIYTCGCPAGHTKCPRCLMWPTGLTLPTPDINHAVKAAKADEENKKLKKE